MSFINFLLVYLVDPLLALALFAVLARLLLQLTRADFRNPLCQAIVKVTNPLILPLRRILPPMGKIDTASVVAVLIVAAVRVAAHSFGDEGIGAPFLGSGAHVALLWASAIAAEVFYMVLWTYFYAIILYALLSMIAPSGYSPLQSVLATLCEPVLRPIRRVFPSVAGLDLSPLWAGLIIQLIIHLPLLF
ncbi:MAG TPA: YggT family protein [Steroidobacteraceae bacterium]|nr:YggT family protein [Steroidobacteraceae bacterium]